MHPLPFHPATLLPRPRLWVARVAGLMLLGGLLPFVSHAQFYTNEAVYNGASTATDPFYSGDGVINATLGNWVNDQGLEIISGPATGTFINHGTYTASNGGTTQFTGATTVEVGGTVKPTFFNLDLDNAGKLLLTNTNGAQVNGTMTFDGTLVDNTGGGVNGALRFGTAGTYAWATGPNDTHHVNGYVGADQTSGTFTYPVGSGADYRPATITAPAGAAVAYLASNPQGITAIAATLSGVSNLATWPVSGLGAGLTVGVSIPDGLTGFAVPAKLRLVGWNGTQWVDLSGGPTASGNTEGSTLTGTTVAGIEALGIGAGPDPLPVTLVSFNAAPRRTDAVLKWATATEQHSAWFTVERSGDGRDWKTIDRVAAAGNSQQPRAYTTTDVGVGSGGGTFYYRLQLVDQDGTTTPTEARVVAFTAPVVAWEATALPNPFGQQVRARIVARADGPATLTLVSTTGQTLWTITRPLVTGPNDVALTEACAALPVGVYLLRIAHGTDNSTLRLVRQ